MKSIQEAVPEVLGKGGFGTVYGSNILKRSYNMWVNTGETRRQHSPSCSSQTRRTLLTDLSLWQGTALKELSTREDLEMELDACLAIQRILMHHALLGTSSLIDFERMLHVRTPLVTIQQCGPLRQYPSLIPFRRCNSDACRQLASLAITRGKQMIGLGDGERENDEGE
eukprot:gene17717-24076_t